MQYIALLTIGIAVALMIYAARLARRHMQEDYSGFSTDARATENLAEGDDSWQQQQLSQRNIRLIFMALGAVVVLAILSNQFWYMPVNVPHNVTQQAVEELPAWFEVTEQEQSGSPLHWRVEFYGTRDGGTDYHLVFNLNRWTGAVDTSLSQPMEFGSGLQGLLTIVAAVILGFLAFRTFPLVFGKSCPNCKSKPYKFVEENVLLNSEMDTEGNTYPMVCEGHYRCELCGFNEIKVYEGSKFGGGGQTAPPDHAASIHLYRDDLSPGQDEGLSMDEETWQNQVQEFKQERTREWFEEV